ncbi:MAG: ketopantoate reductase family protein [Desulfobacteraceae bacterium]|nr:ketopantoate reductase family protein [Desulfobacteraceae bacterium]
MRILILGAGALGSLLGARLSATRESVTLLSTNRPHMEAIRRHGLTIEELDGSQSVHHLNCICSPEQIREKPDLVIVVVKSYATCEAVAGVSAFCGPSALYLTLQNGVGNWERIASVVGDEPVLAGSTAQGSTRLGPGRIRHGGNGPTYIGETSGPASTRVQSVVNVFRSAGFDAFASDCVDQLIAEKHLINVGINAITALTGIRNGSIAAWEPANALCRAAVEEAVRVVRARGCGVREGIVERVLEVAAATAVNRSSMGQDVDRMKRTEIDAINGAIVNAGREIGISTPVNETLTRLVKILEAGYLEGGRDERPAPSFPPDLPGPAASFAQTGESRL